MTASASARARVAAAARELVGAVGRGVGRIGQLVHGGALGGEGRPHPVGQLGVGLVGAWREVEQPEVLGGLGPGHRDLLRRRSPCGTATALLPAGAQTRDDDQVGRARRPAGP